LDLVRSCFLFMHMCVGNK